MKFFLVLAFVFLSAGLKAQTSAIMAGDTTVYSDSVVNIKPEFPGGKTKLNTFLGRTVRYTAEAREHNTQGKVIVTFIVEKNGVITNLKIKKSLSRSLDNETLRVIKLMPQFTPGMLKDQYVRTQVSDFPVSYTLAN